MENLQFIVHMNSLQLWFQLKDGFQMKDQKWNNGYLANYKGHNVIVLNQSFLMKQ